MFSDIRQQKKISFWKTVVSRLKMYVFILFISMCVRAEMFICQHYEERVVGNKVISYDMIMTLQCEVMLKLMKIKIDLLIQLI